MADLITNLNQVLGVVWTIFQNVLSTITGNILLFAPIVLAIFIGMVLFAIKKVRSMGLRVGGGRRRRR